MKLLRSRQVKIALLSLAVLAMFRIAVGLPQVELEPGEPLQRILRFLADQLGTDGLVGPAPPTVGGGEVVVDVFRTIFLVAMILFPIALILVLLDPEGRRRLLRTILRVGLLMALLYFVFATRADQLEFTMEEGVEGRLEGDEPPLAEPITPEDFDSTRISPWVSWAISLGVGLLLAVIIYSVVNRIRQSQAIQKVPFEELADQAETAIGEIEAGGDFRNTIIRCYADMNRVVREQRGIQRDRTLTAREFVEYLLRARLPSQPVHRLTELFEEARYGDKPPTPEDERKAINSLRAIAEACRSAT